MSDRGAGDDLRDAIRVLRIELGILNDRVAAAAGLNPRDLDVLDVIDREGPCAPSDLADRTGLRRATLTGVLARLERDGWVARERDPGDGRSVRLASTPRFDEIRALYGAADAGVDRHAAALSAPVRAALVETLGRLAADAREVPVQPRTPPVAGSRSVRQ